MKDINFDELEVGYDVPAVPGMDAADIQTPAWQTDDALSRGTKKAVGCICLACCCLFISCCLFVE